MRGPKHMERKPMSARRVIYTGNFRLFPADAAGRRVLALASALHIGGASVLLYPTLGRTPMQVSEFDPAEDYDRCIETGAEFSLSALLSGIKSLDRLDAVILYNPSNFLALVTKALASFRGVHAVLDLTEWYEYSHLPSFRARAEVFVRMNIIYRLFSRMIFITDFLSQSYKPGIGRVIPPLMAEEPEAYKRRGLDRDGPLRILYAGFPGRKDRIDLLIQWLSRADLPFPVQLVLAGPRTDQIPPVEETGNGLEIIALGPVDRQRVFDLYKECHLSAIIRDDARYERAGFPTKSVEGWSFGVPVLVLSHSTFSQTARECGAAAVIDAAQPIQSLERVLKDIYMEDGRLEGMSEASWHLARDHHRIASYVSSMKDLVS